MEEFFRIQNGRLIRLDRRNPNRQYRYARHPDTGINCYIELSPAEEARRDQDRRDSEAQQQITDATVTLEQRVAVIEQRLNIDPPNRPRNNR